MKNSQLKILFLFLLLAAAMPLFSAGLVPSGLESMGNEVQDVFTGPLVTIICVCCLAGCGVAYAFSKDNEKMKRNIIAIGIGIIIIVCAKEIVGAVWKAAK